MNEPEQADPTSSDPELSDVPADEASEARSIGELSQDDVVEIDEGESHRDSDPPVPTIPAGDIGRAHLKGLIEALVFVSDHPLSVNDIAKAAGKADRKLVRALADELRVEYGRRGIHLEEVAGGLIFRTSPAYGPFVRDAAAKKPVRMTRAQLEALAIIAYRQPLTRPDVDDIRGVDSGPVMKMLLDRDLIKILGKKDEPGRPLLYGTTPVFLEFFGLKSLKDLPSLREFTDLSDDSRRVYDREMAEAGNETTSADIDLLAAAASVHHGGPQPTHLEDLENDGAAAVSDRPTDPVPVMPVLLDASRLDRPTDPDSMLDTDLGRPTDPDSMLEAPPDRGTDPDDHGG